MKARLDPATAAPGPMKAMMALEEAVRATDLEPSLVELVKIRASQINGCGYCLHLHTADARRGGESEARLHLVSAWRESTYFTPREQAAPAWTEALTLVPERGAPEALYKDLRGAFEEADVAALTFLVATINGWNRLAIAFHLVHPQSWRGAA